MPKLEGKKQYDTLVKRLAECEAADKLCGCDMSSISERDLLSLLQVLDGADSIALPVSVRLRLVERNARDLCTGITHGADDLARDCAKFVQTVLPLKLQDFSFDMFSPTFTSVLGEELEQAGDEQGDLSLWLQDGDTDDRKADPVKDKYEPDWKAGRLIFKACSSHKP